MSQNENQNPEFQLKSAERQKFSIRALCFITDICIASLFLFYWLTWYTKQKIMNYFFRKDWI